jgi:hypothetical protein
MNDKFISALNKSSERYNEVKRNYPQNMDWFKNYVISNLIMSFGRTKELEINDGTYYSIHEYLKKSYSDEIEERWYELRSNSLQEQIRKVLKKYLTESDPKVGTGKKPKDSDRRLYTDENPKDTVSVKFRTKQDIVDTLNKESFKSKSHARQSQIINLIHQRLRVALERAKDPEVKKRLKTAFDYIESKKEESKKKTQKMKEGLHDTSWRNEEGDKVTLMDLLNATEDIPVERVSVEEIKPHLLTWDGDEEEVKKIEKADLQYPILIFVNDDGEFISIIDGHHRAQKAARKGLETIKAKRIPINSLPREIKKVFRHMGRQEEMKEGELTEKCWPGYTQKGMKTMFGKRYPNCVKKKKK